MESLSEIARNAYLDKGDRMVVERDDWEGHPKGSVLTITDVYEMYGRLYVTADGGGHPEVKATGGGFRYLIESGTVKYYPKGTEIPS